MPNRCTGKCCESFPLSMTPEELRELSVQHAGTEFSVEYRKILDMVIPIELKPDGTFLYTCKWFSPLTRLCTNYQNRPQMCSQYPDYGTPERFCQHCWQTTAQMEGRELIAINCTKVTESRPFVEEGRGGVEELPGSLGRPSVFDPKTKDLPKEGR